MEELFRQILDKIVPTAVNAGIQTLVTGQDFGDAFKQQAGLAAISSVLGQQSPLDLFKQQQTTAPAPQQQQQPPPQQVAISPRVLSEQDKKNIEALSVIKGISEEEAEASLFPPEGITSIGGADKRGFFESLGDVVTGDAEGGRMGAIKQAFLPDPAGDPDPLRKYGPLGILGLLAAYQTGAFDPVTPEKRQPYGGVGGLAGLQATYPGTYRPGVPQIARPAGMAAGGFPRKTGAIAGPGTETSDDIPAMLSDGEFVMTAQAVRGAGNGNREAGIRRMYDIMNGFERSVA